MKIISIKKISLPQPKQFYDVVNCFPNHNFGIKTNSGIIFSHNCAFFDEINFVKNQDIDKQKKIAIDMIDTALGGMQTRFIYNGKNPTLMILASSKRSEKSFLEEHMKKKLADEDASVMIIDKAVWDVKPPETYSGKRFYVAVGNKFLASEIIPSDHSIDDYAMRGYNVISVPEEFKSNFRDDIDRALQDYAGISSSDLSKYISGVRV